MFPHVALNIFMSSVSLMMGLLRNQHQLARPTNKEALDWYKQNLKNGKVSEEATRIGQPFRRQNSRKILKVSLQVTRVFKLVCSGNSWGKRVDQEKIMIFLLQTSGRTSQMKKNGRENFWLPAARRQSCQKHTRTGWGRRSICFLPLLQNEQQIWVNKSKSQKAQPSN